MAIHLKLSCSIKVFITEYYWVACKKDFQPRIKITTSGVTAFNFFGTVMDGFLPSRGIEHLHLIYSFHYPLVTAVGGLSNSENQN